MTWLRNLSKIRPRCPPSTPLPHRGLRNPGSAGRVFGRLRVSTAQSEESDAESATEGNTNHPIAYSQRTQNKETTADPETQEAAQAGANPVVVSRAENEGEKDPQAALQ